MKLEVYSALMDIVETAGNVSMTPINTYHKEPFHAVSAADMNKLKQAMKNWLDEVSKNNNELIEQNEHILSR